MLSAMGTVPQGLDTAGRAEIQSGAKEMLLTRLETRPRSVQEGGLETGQSNL